MDQSNTKADAADLAIVLSGGGARASYQVGVLAAVAEQAPELKVSILTGVSAGAINTLYLAAHPGSFQSAISALQDEWRQLTADRVYAVRPIHLGRSALRWMVQRLLGRRTDGPALRGLMDMEPLRRFLSNCVDLRGIRANLEGKRLRAAAVSTTCYDTGQTVTFVQGAPDVPMWERHMRLSVRSELSLDHLIASAAIPIVFPATRLGESGFYGDGSIRQMAPLAPAIHLGARRILAVAMRAGAEGIECAPATPEYPAAAQVLGLLLHSIFLDSLDADAERLERINDLLRSLPPERRSSSDLQLVDLLVIRPSRDLGKMARGVHIDLPPLVKLALKGIGGERVQGSDLLSYLLFEPAFTQPVMDLGYEDGRRSHSEIQEFLERAEAEQAERAVES